MPTQALRDALDQHAADVIQVLLNVPSRCRERHVCDTAGVCAEEIRESRCFG